MIRITPAVIGSIQAAEVIKYIIGVGNLLTDRLIIYDWLNTELIRIKVKKAPDCEYCQPLACGRQEWV